jgi:outer membrane protein OmpA-like peptidoglycan-associated protein
MPARLTLFSRFFEKIRDDSGTAPELLASLAGTLSLSRSTGEPIFRVDSGAADAPGPLEPEAPLEDPNEPSSSSPPRRTLTVAFDAGQFPALGELALVLPASAEGFNFVEIAAELEVAGAVEASLEQNDVLDVPLLSDVPAFFPAFEPRIVDEIGEPLSSLAVSFQLGEVKKPKVTDDKGVARLFDRKATVANLELPPPSELKVLLKPRWDKVRGAARLLPTETVQTLLVQNDMDTTVPVEVGVRTVISLQPRVERARLLRFFFDTDKTFLLPDLPEATDTLLAIYERNTPSKLLIVGHADTSGDAAYNDKLSLERAETLLAYLKDDVEEWLKWYGTDVPKKKRWGSSEDLAMIGALPDGKEPGDPGETPIFRFQRTRGLKVDGVAGPETRRALITEYMSLDKATLPPEIEATVHGAGEHFPDSGSPDGTRERDDRRAELFFFDDELGIQPPAPGKNSKAGSKEYPEWVRRADLTDVAGLGFRSVAIRLLDPLNRPLLDAPYELKVGKDTRKGRSDERGFLIETNVLVPNRCTLRWTFPEDPDDPEDGPGEFLFEREVFLDYSEPDDSDKEEAARRRLHNLGYLDPSFAANIRAFQRDFALPEKPFFDQVTFDRLLEVHDTL